MALIQIIIDRQLFRQLLPILIGALLGVSFGTMLGWPSIAFPLLLDEEVSPILITLDQSSMIAGFLMEGNIIGTLFSTVTILGNKRGVLASCGCQLAGWIVMFFAQDIPGIGVSRFLVGFGHGFGLGQLRMYTQETCEPKVSQKLLQYLPISINVGVVLVYSLGTFINFRILCIVCGVIPLLQFFIFAAIPKTTANIQSEEKPVKAIETISQSTDLKKVEEGNNANIAKPACQEPDIGFIGVVKDKKIRNVFILLCFLIFIPQYTGGAANIVYSQIVHIAALNPYPQACAVIYSLAFLFSNILALKYVNKFPRRPVLIGSCIICAFIHCLICSYFYFMKDILGISTLFVWSPIFLLSLFNFFHTMGVHVIPLIIINDRLPKSAKVVASKFYLMHFSLSAVLSTKIFQVLFTLFGMHMPYIFLSSVAFGSGIIAFFVLKEPTGQNKIDLKIFGYHNEVDLADETNCNEKNGKAGALGIDNPSKSPINNGNVTTSHIDALHSIIECSSNVQNPAVHPRDESIASKL